MAQKRSAKKPAPSADAPKAPRRLQIPKRRRKLSREQRAKALESRRPTTKLPSSFKLLRRAMLLVWKHKKTFGIVILVFAVLNAFLVPTLSGADLGNIHDTVSQALGEHASNFVANISEATYVIGTAGNAASEVSGVYRFLLVLIGSLGVIWLIREMVSGQKVRMRDGFYRGMYPLIPFVGVLAWVVAQLLPLAAVAFVYSLLAGTDGVASLSVLLGGIVVLAVVVLSVYWICSSFIALYIVALPNIAPMEAIRTAKDLVRPQRWAVIRRIIFLPVLLFLVAFVILLPLIFFATAIAGWVFVLVVACMLPVFHAYMYLLYRELLQA